MTEVNLTPTPDGRLPRKDAAIYLGVAKGTLEDWQLRGIGPRSFKVGGRRFYWVADLDAFVRGNRNAH